MAVDVAIFERRNLAYLRFHGRVTPTDSLNALDRVLSDPRSHPDTTQLADLSSVDDICADFVQTLTLVVAEARLSSTVLPGTRYAVYAPADLTYGAARMYHQIAETALPYQIEVFRDQRGALAHLCQPERTIPAFLIAAA